jgi:hypothetical protein
MWGRINMLPRSTFPDPLSGCQRASPPAFAEAATRRQAFLSAHRAHNIIRWLRKEHFLTNEINIQNYLRSDRRLLTRIAILIEDSNSLAA